MAAELRVEYEKAKKDTYGSSSEEDDEDENTREVVILTETDSKGFTRPLKSIREERLNAKRRVETHEGSKRVRYFADDDSQSLQQMVITKLLKLVSYFWDIRRNCKNFRYINIFKISSGNPLNVLIILKWA